MSNGDNLEVPVNLLNYGQASQLLNVKVNTLYAWVSRKAIPFVRLSPRVVRFRRAEIDRWMSERSVRPAPPRAEK
jgi:excisionase family DNA binding protein